ncbi:Eukaryotic translation initiation factor 3 subunit M [Tyrophagus putrescentiae]|nr:Eukaryotic translation initiation factor 3 subunit M [Tyrophagus putrescentiae]
MKLGAITAAKNFSAALIALSASKSAGKSTTKSHQGSKYLPTKPPKLQQSTTMPVETFIDITEKEQCEELREYMLALGAAIPPNPTDSYLTDLSQIISVCDIVFKNVEREAEVEMVLNSIVSVLIFEGTSNNSEACSALVASFCDQLAKTSHQKMAAINFRVLQNLFNGLTNNAAMRFRVCNTIVKLSAVSGQMRQVVNNLGQLKKWFPVEVLGAEKIQSLLRLLHSILMEHRQPELAHKVMVELLTTYTDENASQAREDARKCIVAAIADPHTFLMDYLLALKAGENLAAYLEFAKVNANQIETLALSHEANLQKMRLLTFMQMAETKKELPYADIQKELQLAAEQVELFVIEVLKTKLVKAHIDQANRRVVVSCTMHRTFGRAQWSQLRDTLNKCDRNMASVQQTLYKAVEMS